MGLHNFVAEECYAFQIFSEILLVDYRLTFLLLKLCTLDVCTRLL